MVFRAGDAFDVLYREWKKKLEGKHGADRYYWENMPFFSQYHKWKQGAQRAEDYYHRTQTDDYYGDRYTGALDSLVNSFTGPVGRAKRMARNVEDIFDPEVEDDVSPRMDYQRARLYEQDRWFEYQRRKKYNDW